MDSVQYFFFTGLMIVQQVVCGVLHKDVTMLMQLVFFLFKILSKTFGPLSCLQDNDFTSFL